MYSVEKMFDLFPDLYYVPALIQRRSILAFGMTTDDPLYNDSCATNNCSGHGECNDGVCTCEVQFYGDRCMEPNIPYFVAFATIFYIITAVSFVQLVVCIRFEYVKMKEPSVMKACRVTTQKAIYVVIFIASVIRGTYFSYQGFEAPNWAQNLLSAYYPILLTGSSLIVCFWAEVFHLQDLRLDQPSFLGKSFLGFIGFNIIAYSLLLAEFLVTQFTDEADVSRSQLTRIFYGCYAILLFIVLVFFLFYGVEVYFKVRGGFTRGSGGSVRYIDTAQLHQSRFGLVFQACMLMITVCFLFSEILGQFWKDKVAVLSRNYHDVVFRVVELGVALWFPCVLWNCISPEQLWILNPRKILKRLDLDRAQQQTPEAEALCGDPRCHPHSSSSFASSSRNTCSTLHAHLGDFSGSEVKVAECWICYDSDRSDAGNLIQPCLCKGDVGAVHHECLRKWLVESANRSPDGLSCKVCKQAYVLQHGQTWLPAGFTFSSWLYTLAFVTCMCGSVFGAWTVIQIYQEPFIRMLATGMGVLVFYVCLKFLGFSAVNAYQRAKVSAGNIMGRPYNSQTQIHDAVTRCQANPNEFIKVNVITSGLPSLDETRL